MTTFLAQNQFGASVPCADDTAGSSPAPLRGPAVPLSETGPDIPPGPKLPADASVSAGLSDIPEIFRVANLLCAARQFVPDYEGIWDAMHDSNAPRALETDPVWADEPPLFLQKREA